MKNPFHCITLVLGFLASGGAFACTCAQSTVSEQYGGSTQVFIAMVVHAREITGTDRSTHVEASIEVVAAFKGTPRNGDILRSGLRPRTYCEIPLTKGQVYLVYLGKSNWVGICNAESYDPEDDRAKVEKLRALRDRK